MRTAEYVALTVVAIAMTLFFFVPLAKAVTDSFAHSTARITKAL